VRRQIKTDAAPAPIAPYSQAMEANGLVFTAGQIGLDPLTGELAGDFAAQAEQVMRNLEAVLIGSGSGWDQVVKLTVFLTDISNGPVVNELCSKYLPQPFPARSTVAVAALPRGAQIEIECVALAGDSAVG
jgi:2-iminobutanoate/2-iminopropanoate deaminase